MCAAVCACILLCLAACGNGGGQPGETENTVATQGKPPVETTAPTEPQPPAETTPPTQETEPPEEANTVSHITLEKSLYTYFEWVDGYDNALVRSEHSA